MEWKMSSKTRIPLNHRRHQQFLEDQRIKNFLKYLTIIRCLDLADDCPWTYRGKIVSGQRRRFSKFRPKTWNLVTRNKFWERGRGPALCLITARHHQSFREQFSVKLSETKYLAGVNKKHIYEFFPYKLFICFDIHSLFLCLFFWPK